SIFELEQDQSRIQKNDANMIVQQPKIEQRDNFPKHLRGGGACFDW
ncbi:unnamed protein product, partial [Didymodactylos carnosus]